MQCSYDKDTGPELEHLEALQLPPKWTWIGPWEPLIEPVGAGAAGKDSGTDAEGWSYTFNFGGSWSPTGSAAHFVRRRTWRRRRARQVEEPAEGGSPAAAAKTKTAGLFQSLSGALRGSSGVN
jgi:hypothetical protein